MDVTFGMNRNKKGRNMRNEESKSRKIIRCKQFNKPVFEHDSCPQFKAKSAANDQKICKNCISSF
jgi:hypothetical protein